MPIPLRSRVITQRNVTFSRTVSAFDHYANPTSVTRASSLGHSRSETTQYHHNTTRWVIGQVGSVTEAGSGAVMRSNSYDPITARLSSTREFGQPATAFTYHPDGTVWKQTDGANQTTTFTNYQRGIAQNVAFADSSSLSAVVNDEGEITAVTDAAGYTTLYHYDLGGRLERIIHPSSDTPPWNDTTLTFVPVASAEDGTRRRQYLHTDALGSPVRTTTATGVPSGRGDYKPYGWGPLAQSRPGFTGHVADAETGLIYMQAPILRSVCGEVSRHGSGRSARCMPIATQPKPCVRNRQARSASLGIARKRCRHLLASNCNCWFFPLRPDARPLPASTR